MSAAQTRVRATATRSTTHIARPASTATTVAGEPYDVRSYRRGWQASARDAEGALDRADARDEPEEWYDGYFDETAGRPRYHYRDCENCTERAVGLLCPLVA